MHALYACACRPWAATAASNEARASGGVVRAAVLPPAPEDAAEDAAAAHGI